MKQRLINITLGFCLLLAGCSKGIEERNDAFPALTPVQADVEAGSWKPVLLSKADEFTLLAPAATNTPAYAAELLEIKGWQANMSNQQKEAIRYWGAGGVLRWNEIMRELVAKYNLPPYQNADGTYPVPSAANPFAYPMFPFANPPYAARAYAYVAAAQYDALVAAWYYKKLYNQQAPYKVDAGIKAMLPQSGVSSYPSEGAVLAGVTSELLKLLFPAEQSLVQQKAAEQQLVYIMAGANTRSEVEAGFALGKMVAQKFVGRARTDNAGKAVGTPADWKQMEADCIARGEMPWKSLELPARPPMLAMFGKVKGFLMDSLKVISSRPAPPPSTGSEQFRKELAEIKEFSENPTAERIRIVQFWADGVGTYTPPGHWNAIAAEEFVQKGFSEVRWARNLALLNMAMMDAAICCWDTKFHYFNPRPSQVDPSIKTQTGTPNFPSFTSGHSTFSGAAATLLGYVVPEKAQAFQAMANEASLSRMYGAIHYRSDCEVGLKMGKAIGEMAISRARTDGAD
ncbi:PAP2 superfamily protein [Cnuella takakiae]|uniref:PAP2 superfamily protein n=1 Tax=Cnuella takakiae TaxID=1302690 RepID=A0A1M5IRP0_9BACT|nr:phosphatase PAP2 family protein [Cnuella takakiae]OLY93967.1 PA-phosphatase [Cnuella takakiae]SHG31008.1 PAP2 superfamily protein [Cnuella takakiae]